MDIQLPMILFQILNFGIVLGALWYLLYKPVLKIFAERAKRIEEGQKAAEKAIASQEKIEKLQAETEQELKKKSSEILKAATDEAKKQQAELLTQAKATATAEIEKLNRQWQEEKQEQIRKLQQDLVQSVFQVTAAVLPKSLDEKAHAALIDQELQSLTKQL